MKAKLYVHLKESASSGYILIERMFHENKIESEYNYYVETLNNFGLGDKVESLESFKLKYLLLDVEYDGRKGRISDSDVITSLVKLDLIELVSEGGMFGGYYKKTEKLKELMEINMNKRKELVGVA